MHFDEFFKGATGNPPYGYQRVFAEAPSLPDLLEAPTGSGKTATAVLGWLWRRLHGSPAQRVEAGHRLIFCLPMRTLVEQTERSVRTWRERLGLEADLGIHVLLGGAVDEQWEEYPDRNLVLIGTQDQLLSRALMRGYAMSRYRWPVHFALLHNDCTWVMDEVQLMGVGASTAAQLQAFREHLQVCGSAKTVWMTATLAEGRLRTVDVRRGFTRQPFTADETPLLRRLNAKKSVHRAAFAVERKGALAALATEVAAAHESGTLTLVVLNRVARAQELHALLSRTRGIENVALVHSRFRPRDRQRIQQAALSGTYDGILVATQAIEAGVDISAKTLFTELAPWPSMVQRFGRLNRAAEHEAAKAYWIDLDTDDDEVCLPYDRTLLVAAKARLADLVDAGPSSLANVASDPEEPTLPVLRSKDLLELFDTEPDLAGHDIDVSRYIRATDDRDVQVAWREIGKAPPSVESPELQRNELCAVPIHELRKLTKESSIWRFDSLRKKWIEAEAERLFPGLVVVVDIAVGGYSNERGFTGDKSDIPVSLESSGPKNDTDDADTLSHGASDYVTLKLHAEDTAEEMRILIEHMNSVLPPLPAPEILTDAARWHDVGKVHPAFQQMLTAGMAENDPRRSLGPWAKSDGSGYVRNSRRFFRHELASALAWLAEGKSDLGAFLVAAHHGKVRLSLRARPGEEPPPDQDAVTRFAHGVHEGDLLPAADIGAGVVVPEQRLSLACMELGAAGQGASWSERMLRVLQQLGPFRLAFFEMLVRVADWRASQRRVAPTKRTSEEGTLGT